ncbi:hypothetical protein U0035_15220 [Niabella yanshanensis]|uniref:Uncharacterized protein n=1 Tax=Niabella yanshanensis TaxID=577386 RepID=A0ABZ0W666_9BACT|nr:hypothetical protein [Niabella yanshanensis]WQD37022.1 hypothetical protein U0035_15220 [Niabella yanshanensis]
MKGQVADKKLELIQWLSTLEDDATLNKLIEFKNDETALLWNQIADIEKESISKGIEDADQGKLTDHSFVRKLYEKWL